MNINAQLFTHPDNWRPRRVGLGGYKLKAQTVAALLIDSISDMLINYLNLSINSSDLISHWLANGPIKGH